MFELVLPEQIGAAEAEAALALGRLDGALRHLPASAQRILAARLLREVLITALRQEGHAFTQARFHAWLAGLVPLADPFEPTIRTLRPPRALVLTLLTALSHAKWPPLATMAVQLAPAVLAMPDPDAGEGHQDTHDLLEQARGLLTKLEAAPSPLPFALLARMHSAVGTHATFAPIEGGPVPLGPDAWRLTVERAPAPAPCWAIEAQLGDLLHGLGFLHVALPCPGLIRLDALASDAASQLHRATTLRDLCARLAALIEDAHTSASELEGLRSARRNTSRVPALFEWLAGFGALRSAQIERVIAATRLGVSGMLGALDQSSVLTRDTVAGAHLYQIAVPARCSGTEPPHPPALSSEVLREYDASMAEVEALLSKFDITANVSGV